MSSGERPIGAAKGKQSDTEALCQPPPTPSYETHCISHRCGGEHPPKFSILGTTLGDALPTPAWEGRQRASSSIYEAEWQRSRSHRPKHPVRSMNWFCICISIFGHFGRFRRDQVYCFRPFWPFLEGSSFSTFGHFGRFRRVVVLSQNFASLSCPRLIFVFVWWGGYLPPARPPNW